MNSRHVVDIDSGDVLLFPDHLEFEIASRNEDQGEVTYIITARLVADPTTVATVPRARQIILSDTFFILRQPKSVPSLYFQFIKTGDLEGTVTLVVEKNYSVEVESLLKSDASFLAPSYSGTTEIFTREVEIAKVGLSALEIERVRTVTNVFEQSERLLTLIRSRLHEDEKKYVYELADELLKDGSVELLDSGWRMVLRPGDKISAIVNVQDSNTKVAGDKDVITV